MPLTESIAVMALRGGGPHEATEATETVACLTCPDPRQPNPKTRMSPVSPSGGVEDARGCKEIADRDSRSLLTECPESTVKSWRYGQQVAGTDVQDPDDPGDWERCRKTQASQEQPGETAETPGAWCTGCKVSQRNTRLEPQRIVQLKEPFPPACGKLEQELSSPRLWKSTLRRRCKSCECAGLEVRPEA